MIDESKFAALVESVVRRVLDERDAAKAAPHADKDLVSIKHAAEISDFHPSTIRNLLNAGKLKRYGKGRTTRVSQSDLRSYLASVAGKAKRPSHDDSRAFVAEVLAKRSH